MYCVISSGHLSFLNFGIRFSSRIESRFAHLVRLVTPHITRRQQFSGPCSSLQARDTFDSVYGFAIYVCWIAKNTVAISDRVTVKKTIAILQELSVIKGMVVRHNSSTKWTCSMDEHNVAGHASFTLSCRLSKRTFLLTIIPDDEKLWTVANMRASPSFRKMCYKYYYLALERAYPKVACLNKHMTSQGNPWGGGDSMLPMKYILELR